MKRSEMVNRLIEDILVMDGFLNYSIGGHQMPSSYEEIAETIIDYLVKQGMLPPTYYLDNYEDCKCNYWEPENGK